MNQINDSSHTPGPWTVFDSIDPGDTFGIDAANGEAIVYYGKPGESTGVLRLANARLIAAAPELLAALKDMVDKAQTLGVSHPHLAAYVAHDQSHWLAARIAIAKAEKSL